METIFGSWWVNALLRSLAKSAVKLIAWKVVKLQRARITNAIPKTDYKFILSLENKNSCFKWQTDLIKLSKRLLGAAVTSEFPWWDQ